MKRKLIKQGLGGLTIYLPKQWTDSFHLSSGDDIDILETGGRLIISSDAHNPKREILLETKTENEATLRNHLTNAYRLGYDKIIILHTTKRQQSLISSIVNGFFIGFDVNHQDNKSILEIIANIDEEKQDVLLSRMIFMIKDSYQQLITSITAKKHLPLENIRDLTLRVNQYNNFCRRNVFKKNFTEEKVPVYWAIYTYLLLIQHSILHFCEELHRKEKEIPLTLAVDVAETFAQFSDAYFKKNKILVDTTSERAQELHTRVIGKLRSSTGSQSVSLHYLCEQARLIHVATSPLLAILI